MDAKADEGRYADVTVSGSVTTNGAGDYKDIMTFTGPSQQLWNMLCEGALVQQVDAGEDGWIYDDKVWGLIMQQGPAEYAMSDDMADTGYTVIVVPAVRDDAGNYSIDWDAIDWDAEQLNEMSFTNTYTKSIAKTTDSNSKNGTTTNVQTGDNSNFALWFVLFAVSAAGVIATGVYSRRRRSS